MDDAAFVREMDGARDDFGKFGRAGAMERAIFEELRERLAFDEFHRKEMLTAVFPDVVDGDDVIVMKGGDGLSFGAEAGDEFVAGEFAEEERFDGDNAIEGELASAKHDAHAAASDFFE